MYYHACACAHCQMFRLIEISAAFILFVASATDGTVRNRIDHFFRSTFSMHHRTRTAVNSVNGFRWISTMCLGAHVDTIIMWVCQCIDKFGRFRFHTRKWHFYIKDSYFRFNNSNSDLLSMGAICFDILRKCWIKNIDFKSNGNLIMYARRTNVFRNVK